MTKRQLLALFIINLATFTVGNALGPLLPVFAAQMGGDSGQAGLLMSAIFAGLAGGILAAGRFSDRHAYRKPILVGAGFLSVVTTWLTGRAADLTQLTLLMVTSTFLAGVQIAMVNTLAGLHAGPAERGRVFGVLAGANGLAALLSGLAGSVVGQWGFQGLYTAAALVTLVQPLIALLIIDTARDAQKEKGAQKAGGGQKAGAAQKARAGGQESSVLSRAFVFLFFSSVIAFAASGIYFLGRTLGMTQAGFDTAAISSTVAVGGLVTLPFPLLLGWLSDRIGRRPLLLLCYAAGAASLFILALSTQLWQIWISSALQMMVSASLGIGSALVTDLVPAKRLGAGLSLFGITNWVGMIIGSAASGAAIGSMGVNPALLAGGLLGLLTVFLVIPIRRQVFPPVEEPVFSVPTGD